MQFSRFLHFVAIGAVLLLSVFLPLQAAAFSAEGFDSAHALSDEELGGLRGGFINTNGILIDFALNTRTIIDGVVQSSIIIDSANLDKINADNLRQVIQVGEKNTNAALDELAQNPALLSVIQNSKDNTIIQHFSTLDVTASNLNAYQQQSIMPAVNFQTVIAAIH